MKSSKLHFKRANPQELPKASLNTGVYSTHEIISSVQGQKLHILSTQELIGKRVSSLSYWSDDGWTFDAGKPGSEHSGINWKIEFSDGTNLVDPQYEKMLDWLKRLAWSLLVTPGITGEGKAISGMDAVGIGIKVAVKWLQEFSIYLPSKISEDVVSDFVEDLPQLVDRNGPLTFSQLILPLRFFDYLWRQRAQLEYAGIASMPESPFPLVSPSRLAEKIAEEGVGWIAPLPDDVAVLVINSAQKYIDRYGDEISELIESVYESYYKEYFGNDLSDAHSKVLASIASRNKLVDKFFELKYVRELFKSDLDIEKADDRIGIVRRLMLDLAGACIIVMLGCTGMRVSELAAINVVDGLGKTADFSEVSLSGVFEVFYITSGLVKGPRAPKSFDWLAGMRIVGSNEIPPVIRAYRILESIFSFPRRIAGVDSLFVSMPPGQGLPRSQKGVGRIFGTHLREWMHIFLKYNVDFSGLPNQSRSPLEIDDLIKYKNTNGACIKPTQFRKSFASFSVQLDSRLLPAVAMHFKHVSHAITETGYIGNNPGLLIDRNSLALQKTAKLFFDVMSGNSDLAGRRGEMLEEELGKKRDTYKNFTVEQKWKIAEDFAKNIGIFAWFEPDGGCLPLDSSKMRCYLVDEEIPKYRNIQPKFENRRASLCSGCANYFILENNKNNWIERFKENCLFSKQQSFFKKSSIIYEKRAFSAAAILKRLGEDVGKVQAEVELDYLKWIKLQGNIGD